MGKAVRLPNGKWRIQVYLGRTEDGKQINRKITADTKREAEAMAQELLNRQGKIPESNATIGSSLMAYLNSRRNVLSPSTVREYLRSIKNSYTKIESVRLQYVDNVLIQGWINSAAKEKSNKTIKNEFGLLSSALKFAGIRISADDFRFPQKEKVDLHIPSSDDIKRILDNATGDYRTAVLLAAFGTMRRSEICALTLNDLNGNTITINKAMVKNERNEWTIKTTKTTSSTRKVILPSFVADAFRENGQIKKTPDAITRSHERLIKNVGCVKFRFHDYRHFSASILHAIGVPDKYIMQRGGWSNASTLQNIYQHTFDDVTMQESEKMNNLFETIFK